MTTTKDIVIGSVTIVYNSEDNRWQLPGGGYTRSKERAVQVARLLDGDLNNG